MYGNIIDTFPDDNENPLRFYYDGTVITAISKYAERNIINPDVGETVLKMTVKSILKTHDGYCSGFDDDSDEESDNDEKDLYIEKKEENHVIYFRIPDEFLDEYTNKIKSEILDSESNIINNNITKRIFKKWKSHSLCDGSRYCNLFDIYIPIKIEYVEIVE